MLVRREGSAEERGNGGAMLIAAIVAVVALLVPITYVAYHKFSVVRQEIEFTAPQDGVAAIHLDIHDDVVQSLRIYFADGTVSELRHLDAA
jgi:hypothetical protein